MEGTTEERQPLSETRSDVTIHSHFVFHVLYNSAQYTLTRLMLQPRTQALLPMSECQNTYNNNNYTTTEESYNT